MITCFDPSPKLSREHPIDGLIYDTEHYAGGIMYLNNSGFSDVTFHQYAASRNLDGTARSVEAGKRYEFLKTTGRLPDYYHFLEEEAYLQGRELANRWHAVNPHLILGVWPLLDNWFSRGFLRGLGGAVPSLGLSGVEYYHGSEQSQSMAEYFQSRIPNCLYLPGFYPPYAYTVGELEHHVGQALRTTKHFWMLGPHEELRRPEYQAALRTAFEYASPGVAETDREVNLTYRVEEEAGNPTLIVRMEGERFQHTPLLSLWSKFGGAALCEKLPMAMRNGAYEASIPLVRRMTNNKGLSAGFRSGVSYRYDPTARALQYEDLRHTKLTDGRAYGYFGTTAAWPKSVSNVLVTFDLHRRFRIVRVEVAQPNKLEDRIGGPARLQLRTARKQGGWDEPQSFKPIFVTELKNVSEPDTADPRRYDKRHDRAWLSWSAELPAVTRARWLRLELERVRENSSISLGEVAIWAVFEGEIRAAVEIEDKRLRIGQGSRWNVPGEGVANGESQTR